MKRVALWGGRRGWVQFGGRDYWRERIPVGDATIHVGSPQYLDVGDAVLVRGSGTLRYLTVTGFEGTTVGVKP